MTYFADLSPYEYFAPRGRNDDSAADDPDRNVGWLERGHEFARGPVPAGLVDALLACATRPARQTRGLHACDLCTPQPRRGPVSMQLDGRDVRIGSAEIRVRGADGRWYAAPTLVAHYVAAHGYQPPTQFVDAVLVRARALHVVRGDELARLRALDLAGQLDIAVRVLRAHAAHDGVDIEPLIPRLHAVIRGDKRLERLAEPALAGTPTADIWWWIAWCFGPDLEDKTHCLISLVRLIEEAADAGIAVAA